MAEPKTDMRDWKEMHAWITRLLIERTGEGIEAWNAKIAEAAPRDETTLRTWLEARGVTGYPRNLLVMERFGYPHWFTDSADDLLNAQYAGERAQLRPIYDALVQVAVAAGEVSVQMRKTYVSLVTPRRTFARIQATTRNRVDLGLRLGAKPAGRLVASKIHETMPVGYAFSSPEQVDDEVAEALTQAYAENI